MRILKERTEIAKEINFGKYPVIKIDLSNRDEYGIRGVKVRFDIGKDYYLRGEIRTFNDTKCLVTNSRSVILKNGYSYNDFMEDVEYANTPIIKVNQEILICLYNSELKQVYEPTIIKTGEKFNPFCVEPLKLEKFEVM